MWCMLLIIITVCQAVFIRMLSWQNKDTLMTNQTIDTMEAVIGTSQIELSEENLANQVEEVTQSSSNEALDYEHSVAFIALKIAEGFVLLVIAGGIIAQAVYIIPHKKEESISKEARLLQSAKDLEDYLNNNGIIKFDHSDMIQTIITSLQFSDNKQIDKEDYSDIVRLVMTYYTEYNVKNSMEADESKLSELEKLKRIEYMSFMTYVELSKDSDNELIKGLILEFLKGVKNVDELNEFKILDFKEAEDRLRQLSKQTDETKGNSEDKVEETQEQKTEAEVKDGEHADNVKVQDGEKV